MQNRQDIRISTKGYQNTHYDTCQMTKTLSRKMEDRKKTQSKHLEIKN